MMCPLCPRTPVHHVPRLNKRETFVHFMRDYRLLTEDAAVQVYLLDRAGPAASRGVASD